ncbi:MAG TPA: hypothetical protein VIJ14_00285, partial [Rhabdochlamydiaceae bacterium]
AAQQYFKPENLRPGRVHTAITGRFDALSRTFSRVLRTSELLNWLGTAPIIGRLGRLAAHQYHKTEMPTAQRIALWGGSIAIASGLLALTISTVKMHQFKV